jgi:hypothetical protein
VPHDAISERRTMDLHDESGNKRAPASVDALTGAKKLGAYQSQLTGATVVLHTAAGQDEYALRIRNGVGVVYLPLPLRIEVRTTLRGRTCRAGRATS